MEEQIESPISGVKPTVTSPRVVPLGQSLIAERRRSKPDIVLRSEIPRISSGPAEITTPVSATFRPRSDSLISIEHPILEQPLEESLLLPDLKDTRVDPLGLSHLELENRPAEAPLTKTPTVELPSLISTIPVKPLPEIVNEPQATISAADKETWDRTLPRVIRGIVSIKATTVRPFDTETAGDYTATGFVIDAQRGLILSNRHVVSPAPITAVAIFFNYEEVKLSPIYRDPVHDFGVFRYDPAALKHMIATEIPLRPDLARVGLDIKVVGNDAGEKLSILGSTLARLDRPAPVYGSDMYNDFNTFYFQAASGTSGGSSGSPVLNVQGEAIALNAGGSRSSQSSFYLPLDRVVRAVELIKQGKLVPRGTLQTEFFHQSYDELKRLGLSDENMMACRDRNPEATGLLTIRMVLKGGPAASPQPTNAANNTEEDPSIPIKGLEPSDILLTCNGKYITNFIGLWEIIDDSVGKEITLEVYRAKVLRSCTVKVQDLHSITPDRFLHFGGAVFHDASYQECRWYNEAIGNGTFCASSGFMMWSSYSRDFLVTKVDGKPTPNLQEFMKVIREIPDYKRIQCMTRALGKSDDQLLMVDLDWHFYPASLFVRDDDIGVWRREDILPPAIEEKKDEKAGSAPSAVDGENDSAIDIESVPSSPQSPESETINAVIPAPQEPIPQEAEPIPDEEETDEEDTPLEVAIEQLRSSMAYVRCFLPHTIYGYTSNMSYSGVGLVLAVDPIPLLFFDRTCVPTDMVDIRLTIANKNIPGRIVYMGDFVLLTFDKKLLPEGTKIIVPEWDTKPLKVRESVKIFGLTSDQLLSTKETTISSIGTNSNTWPCNPPRHRLINTENISIAEGASCWGGVIGRMEQLKSIQKGEKIKVSAWLMTVSSQSSGTDSYWTQGIDLHRYVFPIVKEIEENNLTRYDHVTWDLGFEFSDVALPTVSTLGLSEKRFNEYVKQAKKIRGVARPLIVETRMQPPKNTLTEEEEAKGLKVGDILLEIDSKPVYQVAQLTELQFEGRDTVPVLVLRNNQEMLLNAPVVRSWPNTGDRVIQIFGAIVHASHAAAIEQVAKSARNVPLDSEGLYISGVSYGSPALDKMRPTFWILSIDDHPVSTIDDVLKLAQERKWAQGEYVRIKQVNRVGITSIASVKVDDRFWPLYQWKIDRDTGKWKMSKETGVQYNNEVTGNGMAFFKEKIVPTDALEEVQTTQTVLSENKEVPLVEPTKEAESAIVI
ncbi:hypothetical protein H072_2305 [Dactylellina haptotyla CBS 200.50]|uniref:PDZ-like domain-containing protein n=1 Tax=Dactylellina haptotyla (strain CBS 200.50) TaxID=1284197 RepID=S8BW50_DACHA|nr:hypothetical protein H072_2305 [Dactylellina haptotyla CBS 200.50]